MDEKTIILPIDICRICSNLQSALNIRTEKLDDEDVLLHEALEFVSCIRNDFGDGMSQTMCETCSKSLSDAFKFKNQILDAYRCFYKQTSDINFQNESENNDENCDNKTQTKSATDSDRFNDLGVTLSNDAVSFLLEHNNCKTRNEEPLPIEQNLTEKDKLEETYSDDKNCEKPFNFMGSVQIVEKESPAIEDSETEYIEWFSLETNNQASHLIEKETTFIQNIESSKAEEEPDNENFILLDIELNTKNKSKYSCHICHKILPKRSNLEDHLRLHANEKNFVCPFCQKAFVQVANYRTHLRVHTKERPYKCHICPKTYSQAGSLKTHIRSHTNERIYKCEICQKGFTNSSDLDKHKRIHDTTQQFPCHICGRLFTQKANLKIHLNVHFKVSKNTQIIST